MELTLVRTNSEEKWVPSEVEAKVFAAHIQILKRADIA